MMMIMQTLRRQSLGFVLALWATALPAAIPDSQRGKIDELTGAKGSYTAGEDVYRVAFPRTDVKVAVDGRSIHPFLGLTSWAAFTPDGQGGLMVMGDLVLFEDEVNPVMSAALDNGLEVTALHNHFFFDNPRVMFMHIGGHGAVDKLASAVRRALDQVKEIRTARPRPGSAFAGPAIPEANSITASAIDNILGVKGQVNAGMYKAVIGRTASMHGQTVGNQMGVNTWAAFGGTDESAFVDGDFAMLKSELQPVLKSLRRAGIQIVAIHNHMTHEEPQYVFLHYWGKGTAVTLARGLRSALDTQTPKQTAQVVFVCEHGAARSVIAAAYFNKLAAERGLSVRATATGTAPDADFNAATVAGLAADGLPALQGKPRILDAAEARSAQRLVTLGVTLPASLDSIPRLEWNDSPPVSTNYRGARDYIRGQVETLIRELSAPTRTPH